jgi:hypothetical protein
MLLSPHFYFLPLNSDSFTTISPEVRTESCIFS